MHATLRPMSERESAGSWPPPLAVVHDRFFQISRQLLSCSEFEQVLKNVAAGVCEVAGYDRCLIATLGSGGGGMVGRAGFGLDAGEVARMNGCVQDAPQLQELLERGTPVVLQREELPLAVPQTYLDLFQVTGTVVVVPLVHPETGPVGVLFVDRSGRVFDSDGADLQTLSDFADLTTLAVRSAQSTRNGQRLDTFVDRNRIVADLQHGVTQLLFAADLALKEALVSRGLPAAVVEAVRGAGNSVLKANQQLRSALVSMGQDEDEQALDEGIEEQLESLAFAFAQVSGIAAEVELRGEGRSPSTEGERLLVRTVREGLANVRKHANATRVIVLLDRSDDSWLVEVHDDGTRDGWVPGRHTTCADADNTGTAFGLTSLCREARRLDGCMWLAVSPRLEGLQLTTSVPVRT